ncbi:VOC family protein [Flavobacterium sp. SUN052]|uniref:VOC family protein n=1 Tax=Flavobacterium sp. SUN052 TaxID=3002441 RepID=UPI00237D9CE9|nr:VOC family protein [Flavobacterium sp. SUN052]MEC4004724.1 VOC family protein [Flavobacterium sp. SUN052]
MKKAICILLLFLNYSIKAQENNYLKLTLNHIALSVKDVDQTADFYKNVLGFQEITNKTKVEGIRWFSLGDGRELHLVSTVKETFVLNKAIHIAFTTSNFDAVISRLNQLKITYTSWTGELNKITIRADGIKQIYIPDPNGYWIEINSVGQE